MLVVLMTLVFSIIGYLTFSSFLLYHQDAVWEIHEMQQSHIARNWIRGQVDCQLSCSANKEAIPKSLGIYRLSVSCNQNRPREIAVRASRKTQDGKIHAANWWGGVKKNGQPSGKPMLCPDVVNDQLWGESKAGDRCPHGAAPVAIDFSAQRVACVVAGLIAH